jgi:hypothetical protein
VHRTEAERLGALISARRWKGFASQAYELRKWRDDLEPLLHRCRELLSFWQRLFLGGSSRPSRAEGLREVARLGAQNYPEGPQNVWRHAGGSTADLDLRGTGHERWQYAVERAERGAIDKGVVSLLHVMAEDFPHNGELRELLRLFSAHP